MKPCFYLFTIPIFLALPLLLSVVLLLPIILPQYSFIYYSLKPFGQQLFGNKQALWAYLGVISATTAVFIGFLYNEHIKKNQFISTVYAFYEEILRNIDLIFSGEVERSYAFTIFEKINCDYINKLENLDKYRAIRRVYDELYYYREIVKIWRPSNPGDIITEKQFGACNVILEVFENKGIDPNTNLSQLTNIPGNNKWEKLRTQAITLKEKHLEDWKTKLKKDIYSISKVKII